MTLVRFPAVATVALLSVLFVGCGNGADPIADEPLTSIDPESGRLATSSETWSENERTTCALSLVFYPNESATQGDLIEEILDSDEFSDWSATDIQLDPAPDLSPCEQSPVVAENADSIETETSSEDLVYTGTKTVDGTELVVAVRKQNDEVNSVEIEIFNLF